MQKKLLLTFALLLLAFVPQLAFACTQHFNVTVNYTGENSLTKTVTVYYTGVPPRTVQITIPKNVYNEILKYFKTVSFKSPYYGMKFGSPIRGGPFIRHTLVIAVHVPIDGPITVTLKC